MNTKCHLNTSFPIWAITLIGALFFAPVATTQVGKPGSRSTIVKARRLLDPKTGDVLSPVAVLIEREKIKEVGRPAQIHAPAGAKVIDLGNATLMPELIDSHTHLLMDCVLPTEAERAHHLNGGYAPEQLLAIVAEQTGDVGRSNGSGGSGERYHHGPQSWTLRD